MRKNKENESKFLKISKIEEYCEIIREKEGKRDKKEERIKKSSNPEIKITPNAIGELLQKLKLTMR